MIPPESDETDLLSELNFDWKDFEALEDNEAATETSEGTPTPPTSDRTTKKVTPKISSRKMLRKRNLVVDAITSGKSIKTGGESTSAKFIKLNEAANVDMQLLYTKPRDFLSLEGIYSRADIEDTFPGSTEKQNGLRAALMYANEITGDYNSGDMAALRSTLNRICEPSCMLLTHVTHVQEDKTFPDLVIPAGRLFDYFQAITDSFPDGLWTVEESRAKLEGPMVVSSKFQFIGTMLKAVYDVAFSSFNPDGHLRPTVDSPDAIKVVGVFVFALNDAFKVSKIDINYIVSVADE